MKSFLFFGPTSAERLAKKIDKVMCQYEHGRFKRPLEFKHGRMTWDTLPRSEDVIVTIRNASLPFGRKVRHALRVCRGDLERGLMEAHVEGKFVGRSKTKVDFTLIVRREPVDA